MPHLYVVGLQEMVNLEVVGSLLCSKDLERMNNWQSLIGKALNDRGQPAGVEYECIA